MSGKRKRLVVSLKDKLDALARLDKGVSVCEIAKNLGVGNTTVKDWKKNRKDLEAVSVRSSSLESLSSRHTLRKPILELLDEALWIWFMQERKRGTPISGPILRQKALVLHKRLRPDKEFTASEGWLHRWKKRHGVHQLIISGETLSSDYSAIPTLKENIKILIENEGFSAEQLYNVDETGLNYKLLPQKTLAHSQETGGSSKYSSEALED